MRWFEAVMSGHPLSASRCEQRLQPAFCGQVTFALASCSPSQRPLDGRQREFGPQQRQATTVAEQPLTADDQTTGTGR